MSNDEKKPIELGNLSKFDGVKFKDFMDMLPSYLKACPEMLRRKTGVSLDEKVCDIEVEIKYKIIEK